MRSSGGTNFGLFLSVVVLTKSTIACFAAPSFHDGRGSAAAVAGDWFAGCVEVEQLIRRSRSNEVPSASTTLEILK
jgi:hypothetical protein